MSYDLEMYAKALDAMANKQPYHYDTSQDPDIYAREMHRYDGRCMALREIAHMLRMQPGPVWTVYPAHFPNPDAPQEDNDGI